MSRNVDGINLHPLPSFQPERPQERESATIESFITGTDWEIIRQSAATLGCSIQIFLLTGFASLVSRLALRDILKVDLGAFSGAVTLNFEGDVAFIDVLESIEEDHSLEITKAIPSNTCFRISAADSDKADWSLELSARLERDRLLLQLESLRRKRDPDTLACWLKFLRTLLISAARKPATMVRNLSLANRDEALAFYRRFNQTSQEFPDTYRVQDLFAQQASLRADQTAVVYAEQQLRYADLDKRSLALARHLRRAGAGPGRAIALCMNRSAEMPIALLAILRSGSFFVPLDPQHPKERLLAILEECKPAAVITDQRTAASLELEATPVICVDEPLSELAHTTSSEIADASSTADDLAYVIYTSGSTGRPKGVRISQRSLVNLLCAMRQLPGCQCTDRMLALTTISFDIATMDMLLPLIAGGTLVVGDSSIASDPFRLAEALEEHQITLLQATPVTWRMLVNSGWTGKAGLKMISGGEALPRDLANELVKRGSELWNCYGPTETTIYSAIMRIQSEDGIVPVGPPMPNTSFYVTDGAGQLLPPGIPGELCIGGAGVARGYLDRPEMTAERFVPDPDRPGALMFRTGDLVRILDASRLEFLGRLDHQVKLRGYRIELGEIESVLRRHPSIENAAVTLREDVVHEPRLVAYFTSGDKTPSPTELLIHAARFLPAYMLPESFVSLHALPLTGSGKVDRRALAAIKVPLQANGHLGAIKGKEPCDELESQILRIFRRTLGQPELGVSDSFFDFGGYSLLTVRLFSAINRELGLRLPISMLFDAPTVRELSSIVRDGRAIARIAPIRQEGERGPLFVVYSYLLYSALTEIVEPGRPIFGLRELAAGAPKRTVEELAASYIHDIETIAAGRPVHLAGWCAAAPLTVEIARQLSSAGHPVGVVALLDAELPGYKPLIADRGSYWSEKIKASWSFHSRRLHPLSWPERGAYLSEAADRRWDLALEYLFLRYPRCVTWLQRRLGFALPDSLFNMPWSNVACSQYYATKLYPGQLLLIRAADVPRVPGVDETGGWDLVARDGVRVAFVDGDHESMFQPPQCSSLSRELDRALLTAEADLKGK